MMEIFVGEGVLPDATSIAGIEELDDLEQVVVPGGPPVLLDLRTSGRPRILLTDLIDHLASLLDRAGDQAPQVRCAVGDPRTAAFLSKRLVVEQRTPATYRIGHVTVELHVGNIVAVEADALVNASNTLLRLGAGVSGAFRRACGPGLQAEMSARAPIEPGGVVSTSAHGLRAQMILHAATASGALEVIRTALHNIFAFAAGARLHHVAIPGLGMGTGGLAAEDCAGAFVEAIVASASQGLPERVTVVLWTAEDFDAFSAVFDRAGVQRVDPSG